MIRYKELEKYLSDMMTYLLGDESLEFNYSSNPSERVIVERQNIYPMPDVNTITTFRVWDI